jgi:LemA protein
VILVAVLVALFVVAPKLDLEGPTFPRITLSVGALLWLVWSIRLRLRQWRVLDVPTSECAGVAVGFAEVAGRARVDQPLAARGSATPCVYYEWELQQYRRSGKNSRWVTVEKEASDAPFQVVDATGAVWVDPRHAEKLGLDSHTFRVPLRDKSWRQVEVRLDVDEPVYVIGPTRPRANEPGVEFGTDDSSDDYLISDESEAKVARRIGLAAWACTILGVTSAVLTPLLRGDVGVDSDGDNTISYHLAGGFDRLRWFALTAALVFVATLVVSWLLRAYNRLVRVREQAQRAWSLIAVELQRRHDLLGQLVAAVREYARYERDVQTGLAAARADRLPDAAELSASGAADLGARVQAAELVAIAEAYTDLRAGEQYQALAAAIRVSEDRVAAARRFYNDAVTVLRDRRQVFPYNVIAASVTTPTFDLFEADADERAVPGLALGGQNR